MSQNIDYKAILKAHPETISKEQLYMRTPLSKITSTGEIEQRFRLN